MSKPKEFQNTKNPANIIAGRNLRYFMDANGISSQQLAESFGIEKESLQKILSGTNAISGPYNYILLNEYNCDLNFIYGGIARSDTLITELQLIEKTDMKEKTKDAIVRQLLYLSNLVENMDSLSDQV